ncbi:hypothetical protein HK104_008979 [Borealophlyctis nickersoniae]|nr:hypothetical protein HK104_008979 [Borealophlyctis nickersoniae]
MSTEAEKLKLRREARRAKILAAGEDRLSKITHTYQGTAPAPARSRSGSRDPSPSTPVRGNSPGIESGSDSVSGVGIDPVHVQKVSTTTSTNALLESQTGGLRHRGHQDAAVQSPTVPRTPARPPKVRYDDSDTSSTPSAIPPLRSRLQESVLSQSATATSGGTTPESETRDEDEVSMFGDENEFDPTALLGEGMMSPLGFDPSMFDKAGIQGLPAGLQAAATAAAAAAGSGGGRRRRREEPVPLRVWRALHTLAVVALALWSVFSLVQSYGDYEDEFPDELAEGRELGSMYWRAFARKVWAVYQRPIEDRGTIQFGEIELPVWMCFLTIEIAGQLGQMILKQFINYAPASTKPQILEMAGQLGFSSPALDNAFKLLYDYKAIWGTFLSDVLTFIFTVGMALLVAYFVGSEAI